MNLELASTIAESIAAAAVVLSLIYLGYQISAQRKEARLSSMDEFIRQWNENVRMLSTDRALTEVYLAGLSSYENLDAESKVMFSCHVGPHLRIAEGMYRHYLSGRLAPDVWEGIESFILDAFAYPGIQEWWKTRQHWYSHEFQEKVEVYKSAEGRNKMYGDA